LRFVLLIEFIGARGNNSIIRPDSTKLLVEADELALLGTIADCI
jgi:hypothetical protein